MDKVFFLKKFKNKKYISLITFNLFTFLCLINTKEVYFEQNIIRELAEDPRTKGANEMCMDIEEYSLFDLSKLKSQDINQTNIRINFCKDIDNIGEIKSQMIYIGNDNKITKLAGSIHGEENNKNKLEAQDSDDESKRMVKMYLAAGDICKDDIKYKVEFELSCNGSTLLELDKFEFKPGETCDIKIKGSSSEACGIHNKYWFDTEGLRVTMGIALLVGGIFLAFFGYYWLYIGIFLVCISGSLALGYYLILLFGIENIPFIVIIIILFLIIGFVLSIFFTKRKDNKKYYMLLIGGLCGFAIGEVFNNSFITLISTSYQRLIRFIIMAILVTIGVILGRFLPKGICIMGTSIIGSYGMMRSISMFLYKKVEFLNELKIYDLALSGNFEKIMELMSGWFYIYPLMLIIFTVVAIIVQIKINPKKNDIDDYKDLDSAFESTESLTPYKANENLRNLSEASSK